MTSYNFVFRPPPGTGAPLNYISMGIPPVTGAHKIMSPWGSRAGSSKDPHGNIILWGPSARGDPHETYNSMGPQCPGWRKNIILNEMLIPSEPCPMTSSDKHLQHKYKLEQIDSKRLGQKRDNGFRFYHDADDLLDC